MSRRRTRYSDQQAADDLANALTKLPDEWVDCRDMRHSWRVSVDFHVSEAAGRHPNEIRRELVCTRCETIRKEVYHHTARGLDKVHQGYAYPEEYQIKGVPRGVKPSSIVQEEQYRRAMERIATRARS